MQVLRKDMMQGGICPSIKGKIKVPAEVAGIVSLDSCAVICYKFCQPCEGCGPVPCTGPFKNLLLTECITVEICDCD